MTIHPITLNVPDSLYRRLKERAQETKRSVEDELMDVLVTAVPPDEELPYDLAEAVAALSPLDDTVLWDIARSRLSPEISAELESLNWKQQAEGLSSDEKNRQEALIRQYEKTMLTRARAAVLLKERGYNISELMSDHYSTHAGKFGKNIFNGLPEVCELPVLRPQVGQP